VIRLLATVSLCAALGTTAGCAVRIAALSAATTKRITRDAMVARGRWTGRSCRWWVLGVPFGLPRIDEAMTDALKRADGLLLGDLVITSVHSVWLLFGSHCYVVEGEVLG
jgi:hypothetical protein